MNETLFFMKNILIILVTGFLLTSCASSSNFSSFYNDNRSDADFSISTSSFFVNLFLPKEELSEYKGLFKKVKKYKVMVFSNESNALDRDFNRFVKRKKYTSIFKVNDNGQKIDFYFLLDKSNIKEMVVRIKGDDEFIIVGLKTNILERELYNILDNSDIKISSN